MYVTLYLWPALSQLKLYFVLKYITAPTSAQSTEPYFWKDKYISTFPLTLSEEERGVRKVQMLITYLTYFSSFK